MRINNFITFEGGEGTGKSTAIKRIEKMLSDDGYTVVTTREPGGIRIAEEIRKIILDVDNQEMAAETEALLYAASRHQHLYEKVLPALNKGDVVLCDRYLDSSLAYQGIARGLGVDEVMKINMYAANHLPITTYFIDVEPKVALKRIQSRSKKDRLDLETYEFHQKVYNGYKELALEYADRYVTIDGKLPLETIIDIVYKDIKTKLQRK